MNWYVQRPWDGTGWCFEDAEWTRQLDLGIQEGVVKDSMGEKEVKLYGAVWVSV